MIKHIRLNDKLYTSEDLSQFLETAKNAKEHEFYRDVVAFLDEWFNESPKILVHTSGSTGNPKALEVSKIHMLNSAKLTCSFFGLKANDSALLSMPVKYIAGKMMLVRAVLCQLSLWVVPPTSHPLKEFNQPLRFAAMVPMQVSCSMQEAIELSRLKHIEFLLIGGGAIDQLVETQLTQFPNGVYASYGMTETVSHIALRQLNGPKESRNFKALDGVSLSKTEAGALVIKAPLVCDVELITNDLVEFDGCGGFRILGRLDNVINSGGVKLQAEQIEEKLQNLIHAPYVITSISHSVLGEAVVLLIADTDFDTQNLMKAMELALTTYEIPKHIYLVEHLPMTHTQKIRRVACKELAAELYKK